MNRWGITFTKGLVVLAEKKYHHGDLKLSLIESGIKLLDREGYDAFSLRKVAKECNVSQTAPYRHFKDKEDLVHAIIMYVMREFNQILQGSVDKHPDDPRSQIQEMGVAYIRFFVEKPEYLRLIFLSDKRQTPISSLGDCNEGESQKCHPFSTFFRTIEQYAQNAGDVDKDQLMLYSWGLVHGIAVLIANRDIPYDKNYLEVAEKLIRNDKLYQMP